MDFKDLIKQLGERASKIKDQTQTEEATKMALIVPFIQALGYDVFNPSEVVPEFDADIPGLKKGEKVDYAILKDGLPRIFIECKHWKQNLEFHDGQLLRYFHVTKAKFAILTNGIVYKFYTDLIEANKMDSKPFMEFDITKIPDTQVEELKRFHKSYFDEANITTAANELIYLNEIKHLLTKELKNPSEDFIKFIAQKTYSGRVTQNILGWYTDLVKKSSHQVINEMINDRLTSAMKQETTAQDNFLSEPTVETNNLNDEKSNIETTEEEKEGYYIVKAICRAKVDSSRIYFRDAQSYFAILLDDNNRKTICRLHLNRSKKYIETFDVKGGDKKEITSIDDIYNYVEELLAAISNYESVG